MSEAQETGNGPVRKVIVFRLRPRAIAPRPGRSKLDAALSGQAVEQVPVENVWTEKTFGSPSREEHEAERREQVLVLEFQVHLQRKGHAVCRLKIVPRGEARPIFCDLLDETAGMLVEAKGSMTQGAIRMAIGQLADYKRFVAPNPRTAVLPEAPREDLVRLLEAEGIEAIWRDGKGFDYTAVGALC